MLFATPVFADDAPAWREVACRVVDERGAPLRGMRVMLGGVDRYQEHFEDDRSVPIPGWDFVTDDAGRITVRFGKFKGVDRKQMVGTNAPGYGRFYLVVSSGTAAGGVSREILNLDEQELAVHESGHDAEDIPCGDEGAEWMHGEFSPLVLGDDARSRSLTIVVKRGMEVRGRVLDTGGHFIPHAKVSLSLNLHVDTHTGFGGEIFPQEATTDSAGRFRFHHVYPNVFTISPPGENSGPLYWIRTRVRGHWFDRVVDEITPDAGRDGHPLDHGKSIDLRLVVSHRPPYRYFGRVTDPEGHGVAGVKVLLQASLHEPALTYGDNHGSQEASTDEHGDYSMWVGSRFVNWIQVCKAGTVGDQGKLGGIDADGDKLLVPGRYNFKVNP